jgi:predicted nucleic acid-binding protein
LNVVDLSAAIALSAAKASIERRLPMADSIMLVTARLHGATFWTQDADFAAIEGVKYVARK